MAKKKVRLNKDGTPDKRYGKKPVSHIQDIIDSQKAPGLSIAAHHKADYAGPKVDMEEYKRNTNGKDPSVPMCHDERTQTGRDWNIDRLR